MEHIGTAFIIIIVGFILSSMALMGASYPAGPKVFLKRLLSMWKGSR